MGMEIGDERDRLSLHDDCAVVGDRWDSLNPLPWPVSRHISFHDSCKQPNTRLEMSQNTYPLMVVLLMVISCERLLATATNDPTTELPPNIIPLVVDTTAAPVSIGEIYSILDSRGQICALISLNGSVIVTNQLDQENVSETAIENPARVITSANVSCAGNEAVPLITFQWPSSQLYFYFSKDEMNWTLDKMVYTFNSSKVPLEFSLPLEKENSIEAPLGSSYRCLSTKWYIFQPTDGAGMNISLSLSNFKVQPYAQNSQVFGQEMICPEDSKGRHRDSRITVAVGSTLAVLSTATVLCYGIYRHVKIKSVSYNTMQ